MAFTIPTLVIHGTSDKTVPIDPAGRAAAAGIILERERWLAVRQRAKSWKSGAESSGT